MATQELDKYLADMAEKAQKEGIEEGRKEGAAMVLLELLAEQLGPVPAKVRSRVNGASFAELTALARRVLSVTSFDDVLGPTRARGGRRQLVSAVASAPEAPALRRAGEASLRTPRAGRRT